MMIALQVAAGILLAYFIIVNQKKLLAWGGKLIALLALLVALAAMIWAAVAAVQFLGSVVTSPGVRQYLPHFQTDKILTMLGLIPIFILAATGGLGLAFLIGLFVRRPPERTGKAILTAVEGGEKPSQKKNDNGYGCVFVFFGLGALVLIVNYPLSFLVWDRTPIGGWYDELYRYGMTTEWKDGLSLLFAAVLWQWPWIPLGFYFVTRKLRKGSANPSKSLDATEE